MENNTVDIIGAGLAGTEAALQLAQRGIAVRNAPAGSNRCSSQRECCRIGVLELAEIN